MKSSIRSDEIKQEDQKAENKEANKQEADKKEEEQEKLDRDESEEETPGEWPGFGEPKPDQANPPPEPEVKDDGNDKPIVDREWDRKFKDWQLGVGEEPGPHPYPKHKWNTNKEEFIEERANP